MARDATGYKDAARLLEADRAALEQQITAEPFDREKVDAAFKNWQTSWNGFIDAARHNLIEVLALQLHF